MISQLRWRMLTFNCIFLSHVSFCNMCLISGVLWNWGERVWACLLQAGWMPPQLYCAWLEDSQQLHNTLQQRKHGLGSRCPGPLPSLIQCLAKPLPTAGKHSVKWGADTAAERLETRVRKKATRHMMAVRDKQVSDLGVAFGRKPYFPPFSLPCGFCTCFSLLLSQNHSCPVNYWCGVTCVSPGIAFFNQWSLLNFLSNLLALESKQTWWFLISGLN